MSEQGQLYESKLDGRRQGALVALKSSVGRDVYALAEYLDGDLRLKLQPHIDEITRLVDLQIYRMD